MLLLELVFSGPPLPKFRLLFVHVECTALVETMKPNDLLVLPGSGLLIIVTIPVSGALLALAEVALDEVALAGAVFAEAALHGHDDDDGQNPWNCTALSHCSHNI